MSALDLGGLPLVAMWLCARRPGTLLASQVSGIESKPIAIAAVMALLAAACDGSQKQPRDATTASPTGERSPEPAVSLVEHGCKDVLTPDAAAAAARLINILPTSDESPKGSAYQGCEQRLADRYDSLLAYHPDARAKLSASGVLDHVETAIERRFGGTARQGGSSLKGGMAVAILDLSDEGAAAEVVEVLEPILIEQARTVADPISPAEGIPAEGLGERGFGLRGTILPLEPSIDNIVYIWQNRDLVMSIWVWDRKGEPASAPDEEALEISRTMDERVA